MREVLIVTHPDATHARENLVGGWYESSLTEEGKRDALVVAERLRGLVLQGSLVRLVTSDLRRAQQTASPIAKVFGIEPVIDSDLRERSYGLAEGHAPGLSAFLPPPVGSSRLDHQPGTPGTETLREWATRAYRALDRVLEGNAGCSVIVTHGGTLTYLLSAWIRMPLENAGYAKFHASPGGITRLREDEHTHERVVVTLNDTAHIESARSER